MIENGGYIASNNTNEKKLETSFRSEEPPPDPEDFGTKEEEKKNKELLKHLYEQQKKKRELVDRLNLEEKIRKEIEEEQEKRKLIAQKAYYQRRNASAKYRVIATNQRIKQLLGKVDDFMNKITRLDGINKIKEEAQKQFEEEINKI